MSSNPNYTNDDCPHDHIATYNKGKNTLIKACLDCGYTEISVGGIVVRKHFQAPIIFGILKKAFASIEDWVKNLEDS
jgi:hypothetical protein